MKVIHVHAGKANPATTMNGVNVVVDACARTMHRRGMDVEVWGIARNPHTNRPRPEYPISLYQYFDTWPPRLERDLIHAISRVDSPRTVFHFYSGFLPPFVSITRRLRASAYFCMPQGVYSEACLQRHSWRKFPYYHCVEKYFLRNSRGLLLAHENELAGRVRASLGNTSCHVVSNGVDSLYILDAQRLKEREEGRIVWGFCGRIDNAHKAVDRLIRSFLLFRDRGGADRHVLSIIGDGPDLPLIRKTFASAISRGDVQLHDKLLGERKIETMRRMDYFAHVSNWEGMPLACLEAVGLGIPLLVTPGTNLADDVNRFRAGVVAEADDTSIANAMSRMSRLNRDSLVDGCRRLAREKYDWEKIVLQITTLYRNAISP